MIKPAAWIIGSINTPVGVIPRIATRLTFPDTLGTWVAYLFLLPPPASFLAMNFTGSTTYTSLSGVVKEMRIAVPAQIISAGLGILFMAWCLIKF